MNHVTRLRPSPAMVVALVALSVALGGVGYAATVLPSASVGTAQLKNNAVTGAKVKNGSLLAADFKAGQLPAGPTGPAGAAGPSGAAGPAGAPGLNAFGKVTYVEGAVVTQLPNAQDVGVALCPAGERPLGGGVLSSSSVPGEQRVNSSSPTRSTPGGPIDSWEVWVDNISAVGNAFRAYAVCAPATNVSQNFKQALR